MQKNAKKHEETRKLAKLLTAKICQIQTVTKNKFKKFHNEK